MWRFDFDFELKSINFSHPFDFSKSNSISVIEVVSLFFVEANEPFFFFCDSGNMYRFGLFTCSIKDAMGFSEINKCEAVEA